MVEILNEPFELDLLPLAGTEPLVIDLLPGQLSGIGEFDVVAGGEPVTADGDEVVATI